MVTPKPNYRYMDRSAEWNHPTKYGFVIARVDKDGEQFIVRSYKYKPIAQPTIQGHFDTFEDACVFAQMLLDTGAVSA